MKKLEFCKPTKSVTGSWVTFGLTSDQEDDKKNEMYHHYTKHEMKLKQFTIALGWFVFADAFVDLLEDAKKH